MTRDVEVSQLTLLREDRPGDAVQPPHRYPDGTQSPTEGLGVPGRLAETRGTEGLDCMDCSAISLREDPMRNHNRTEDQFLERRALPHAVAFLRERAAVCDRRGDHVACRGEACFRLLAESLEEYGSIMLDTRGHVTGWNAGAERLLGYRPEEIVGKSFTRFFPEEDIWLGKPEQELLAATRGRFEADAERVRQDGTRFRAHITLAPLRDERGHLDGYLLLLRERPREAATDLEPRAHALDLLDAGAFLIDTLQPGQPLVYANPAYVRLTGRAVGQSPGATLPPEAQAALRAKRAWSGEVSATRPDGGPAWHNLSLVPVPDAAGTDRYALGLQTDITERKYIEEWFRQAQKMAAVGWLAGGVIHDFNNLLTAILGYCDILLREALPEGVLRESVQQIQRGGERGAALTRQLLDFSRTQPPRPDVLDLRPVLAETQAMLGRLLGENIVLNTLVDPDLGRIRADAGQIEQVLVNLAVNARDAMPEGGTITLEATNVVVAADGPVPCGSYIRLAVTDTGCGMTEEVRAALFQPLFTTKERGKGTGLGLYTVGQIVCQSRGHITVFSQPGRGTRFEVYLPRVEEAAAAPTPVPKPTPPVLRGSETILVVEDETGVRDVIGHALRQEGYTVLEAGDGAEAVALGERHGGPIALLLCDLVLPKISAPQLVARLSGLYPEMKVLYLSGYPLQMEGSFLAKPFTLQGLTDRVREVLGRG